LNKELESVNYQCGIQDFCKADAVMVSGAEPPAGYWGRARGAGVGTNL